MARQTNQTADACVALSGLWPVFLATQGVALGWLVDAPLVLNADHPDTVRIAR